MFEVSTANTFTKTVVNLRDSCYARRKKKPPLSCENSEQQTRLSKITYLEQPRLCAIYLPRTTQALGHLLTLNNNAGSLRSTYLVQLPRLSEFYLP